MGRSAESSPGERTLCSLISAQRGALMGFAALWIVIFHFWKPVLSGVPVLAQAESYIRVFGFYGVDVFFFLSGMGLVYAIGKHSLRGFYFRRLRKLALPYLAVGLARLAAGESSPRRALALVSGWTLLTDSMYRYLWFVQGIAVLYLLFPLYYGVLKRAKRPAGITLAALALWLAATLLSFGHMRPDLYGFTNRLPIFLLGVLLGESGRRGMWPVRRWMPAAAGASLALGVACGVYSRLGGLEGLPRELVALGGNLFTSLGVCVLLAALLDRFGRALGGLVRALVFYAGFSLEFYCVQDFFVRISLSDRLAFLPPLIFDLAAIALSTALGWALQRLGAALRRPVDRALAGTDWLR